MLGKFSYFTKLVVITAVLGTLMYLAQQKYQTTNLCWYALAYLFLLSYITFKIGNSALTKDNKTFITRIYGAIGIRFIFTIFPLVIYLLFSKVKELPFIIMYLLLYFFYTSFEIYHIVVNLRPDLKQK